MNAYASELPVDVQPVSLFYGSQQGGFLKHAQNGKACKHKKIHLKIPRNECRKQTAAEP
jgi:hypothetical protein